MTLLVVAILLAGDPSPEVDGHAVFARTQQVMLGGARLPWLLLASGSVSRSDKLGHKPSERFVLEWEPCGRRDVRGSLSKVAEEVLAKTIGVLCGRDPVATMRLPHRLQLQAGSDREDWTIERIEIVPLP